MFLSRYQCGFRKGYSTQHWLLAMFAKWKSAVDKTTFEALLTDYLHLIAFHMNFFL